LETKRPLIVAVLPIRTIKDIDKVDEIKGVDFIELRLDYMYAPSSLDPSMLVGNKSKIIVTIRETSEGGMKRVNHGWKVMFLNKLHKLGIIYDVEASFLQRYNVPYEDKIVSVHYMDKLPSKEEVLKLISKYAEKAFSVKIAVKAYKGYKEFLSSLLEIGYDNISVMPMTEDPIERLAFALIGSKLIYCYVLEPTAPGQLHYKSLIKILNSIFKESSSNSEF
jgi:3-dehydroquinate dehydratase-1